jgi:hypothetical protein
VALRSRRRTMAFRRLLRVRVSRGTTAKDVNSSEDDRRPPSSAVQPDRTDPVTVQRLTWRRSAQAARRAWYEWSAAQPVSRLELYRRYAAAADAEERAAAAFERTVNLAAIPRGTTGAIGSDRQGADSYLLEPTGSDA